MILDSTLNAIFSAIPAVGFAMIFNVPKEALKFCAMGGAGAYTLKSMFLLFSLSIELSTFFASFLIGLFFVYISRKKKMPRPIYTVASIIPLIPGTYAFTAMMSLVSLNSNGFTPQLFEQFIQNGVKTIFILGAISFGLALSSPYFIRKKK